MRTWTCVGPRVDPSWAFAETSPLPFDTDTRLVSETGCPPTGCQTTDTFGTGFPAASSTRAVSGVGNRDPGAPDWLSPPRMRSVAAVEPCWGGVTVVPVTVKLKVVWMDALAAVRN